MSLGTDQADDTMVVDVVAGADAASTADADAGAVAGAADSTADAETGRYEGIFRLRDLDRRARWVAAAFAVALLLAPVLAFAWAAPDWAPANDPGLMALRALDVGTSRTPVVGQPSTSALYGGPDRHVDHPGPVHFYLMAVPVRVFGAAIGMLLVSLIITGASVVVAAWAAFRQLGSSGGIVAAVTLGAITFTTGAASLVNPVSSNIAGYPLLCSMVLLWCLLCGDLRLLPLTVGVVSFTAQQHLSVLPTLAVAIALTCVPAVWIHRRSWRAAIAKNRRPRTLWTAGTLVLVLALWAPVMVQHVFGNRSNLLAMVEFAQDSDRPSVGWAMAARQVAHAVGLPPLIGQQNVTGYSLLYRPSMSLWLSAAVVLLATAAVGWRAWRANRRHGCLAAMAGVGVVAGLVNGASVPDSLEQSRLALYHWVWPLIFCVSVSLGVALVGLLRRIERIDWIGRSVPGRSWLTPVLVTAALVAIVGPSVLNPSIDRRSNRLATAYSPVDRGVWDELGDQVLEHRAALGESTVVLERGRRSLAGLSIGLSVGLIERGVDVGMARWPSSGIHRERLVDRETVDSALVLVIGDGIEPPSDTPPGELVGDVATLDFDQEAYDTLVEQSEAVDEVVLGADIERLLGAMPEDVALLVRAQLLALEDDPAALLKEPAAVEILRDHPPEQPRLDPELLDRVLDSLPSRDETSYRLQVYLLDREELLEYASGAEIGDAHDD